MDELDLNTCSMDDVITRSYVIHPSLLAEGLLRRADEELLYRGNSVAPSDPEISNRIARKCLEAAEQIERQDFDAAGLTFGIRIVALSIACKLQGVSAATRTAIAVRDDIKRGSR